MPVFTDYSMEKLIVFGASTPAGISFTTLQEPGSFFTYTRKIIKDTEENTNININHSDLVELLESSSDSFTFVSFIPIWHLADLMQGLRKELPPISTKLLDSLHALQPLLQQNGFLLVGLISNFLLT